MAFDDKMLSHCNQSDSADCITTRTSCSSRNSEINLTEDPKDLPGAQIIIDALRLKCREQTDRLLKWKKAYQTQEERSFHQQKKKNEQLNAVTSQLLLLQSRLMRKQKQICSILGQRDMTICRQQKIIEQLSSRLIDHGIDAMMLMSGIDGSFMNNGIGLGGDFDSLNDSDSAVVLEDIDSDCNSSSLISSSTRCRKPGSSDVTIIRSISDAIETNLKYSNVRRSNCFLRRPDILETVYSVEEDPEPQSGNTGNCGNSPSYNCDITEKREKFKQQRTDKIIEETNNWTTSMYKNESSNKSCDSNCNSNHSHSSGTSQVTNYNRVMSNHRSVTKPKDVKYKRINKAKSKSLEELRGKLRHWVERGNSGGTPSSPSPISECDTGTICYT